MLKKITKIYLLTLFLIASANSCEKGCLKCSPDSNCEICDFLNHYSLTLSKTCEIKKVENCLYLDNSGKCLKCEKNFYQDKVSLNCVKIEELIENCVFYKSWNSCLICEKGFFLKSSGCETVEEDIEGCLVYSSETSCTECEKGYVRSLDYLSCRKISGNEFCSLFNFVHCGTCASGYSKNQSYYKKYFLESNIGNLVSFFVNQGAGINTGFPVNVCQKNIIENCINFESYNKCKICSPGYYLDLDKTCKLFPRDNIQNCYKYKTASKCLECSSSYFLSNLETTCSPDIQIENCDQYSPLSQNESTCLNCTSDFFLSTNICLSRSNNNITNCKTYASNSDKCETCKDLFQITSDGLKCLDFTKNCLLYETSTSSTSTLLCKLCKTGYYMTDSICLKGSRENCTTYEPDSHTCKTCKNTFYLDEDKNCVKHKDITNCEVYKGHSANECEICDNSAIIFEIESMCKVTQEINGCLSYKGLDGCEICEDGFEKIGEVCEMIDLNLKCLVREAGVCVRCVGGFVLDEGVCLVPISFISGNCFSDNLGSGTMTKVAASCSVCEEGSIPYDFNGLFLCYEELWVEHLISVDIPNCQKIEFAEPSNYSCQKCNQGFYNDNGSCVEDCDDKLNFKLSKVGSYYNISKQFVCGVSTQEANCEIYSPLILTDDGDITEKCLQCKEKYISVVLPLSEASLKKSVPLLTINFSENNGYPTSPITYLPTKTCTTSTNINITTVPFCEYYTLQAPKYRCTKCKHGKTGILKDEGPNTYITLCENLACTITKYPGLQPELNSLISCLECSSAKIPFLFGRAGTAYETIKGLKAYNLDEAVFGSVTEGGKSVNCHTTTDTALGVKNISLPDNCAVAFMNVEAVPKEFGGDVLGDDADKRFNVDLGKIAVFCLACKRGMKRVFGSSDAESHLSPGFLDYMVAACEDIEHCANSKWLNYCSECVREASYLYVDAVGVDYSTCLLFPKQPNCFAAEQVGEDLVCKFCEKGYSMNFDGICEMLNPPKCNSSSFKMEFKHYDINTALFLNPEGVGCTECHKGYTPIRIVRDTFACTTSPYITTTKEFLPDTKFISNCINYYKQSSHLKCKKCKTNFIISSDFSKCYPDPTLKNCILAESLTNCLTCTNTYISVDFSCQLKEIKNCEIFNEDASNISQICDKCEVGYFLDNNTCLYGLVPNCEKYVNDVNSCSECKEGYMKITDKNGSVYCFLYEPRLQCLEFDEVKFQNQVFNCKKCVEGVPLYLTAENIDRNLCSMFSIISHCEEYEKISSFGNSSFYCAKCETGYWASNNFCEVRVNNDKNCLVYELGSDSCQECLDGFFVSSDGSECSENPNGVKNCEVYSSATKCVSCKQDMYLSNNECIEISEKIPNCLYYKDPITCGTCSPTFFLSEKTCIKAEAKNCLLYETQKKCKSCSPKYGLKPIDDLISCIEPSDPNCLDFIQTYPFICNICIKDFYSDEEGQCAKVTKIIPNCIRYKNATNCSACKKQLKWEVN